MSCNESKSASYDIFGSVVCCVMAVKMVLGISGDLVSEEIFLCRLVGTDIPGDMFLCTKLCDIGFLGGMRVSVFVLRITTLFNDSTSELDLGRLFLEPGITMGSNSDLASVLYPEMTRSEGKLSAVDTGLPGNRNKHQNYVQLKDILCVCV